MPRVFKETQDQIIIQQGRGLQIVNNAATQRIIEAENYYKLFNGYKEPFLDSTKSDETYLPGTKFEEIYALYLLIENCVIFLFGISWKSKIT